MRRDLGNKMNFLPLPVLMIGTYDKENRRNIRLLWSSIRKSRT